MAGLSSAPGVPVLEIGGTHVTAAVVDGSAGRVLRRERSALDSGGSAEDIVGTLLRAARGVGRVGPDWGVAVPGPFDYARGIGRFEDVGKFDSLAGYDLGAALDDGLGAGTHTHFLNDADAFGIGEALYGAGRGHERSVCVTVGTGIGSAFLAHGQPVNSGPQVPPDGSVHLLTWEGRPLEETVSARAIRRRFAELGGPEQDVLDISSLARGGDARARRVLHEAFHALGACLGPWVDRFGATVLVVGGSIAGSFDLLEAPVVEGLRQAVAGLGVAVVPAAHPDESALLGAAHHTAAVIAAG